MCQFTNCKTVFKAAMRSTDAMKDTGKAPSHQKGRGHNGLCFLMKAGVKVRLDLTE